MLPKRAFFFIKLWEKLDFDNNRCFARVEADIFLLNAKPLKCDF